MKPIYQKHIHMFALVLCLFVLPTSSVFANCGDYFRAKNDLEVKQQQLLREYSGTAMALVGCMGACANENNPAGCALAACGLTCLAIGFDNCSNFLNRASSLEKYAQNLAGYNNKYQCTSR